MQLFQILRISISAVSSISHLSHIYLISSHLISSHQAPRAVIMQALPFCTIFTVYAEIFADSPLYIPSSRASAYFPPMFIQDALQRARAIEMGTSNASLTAGQRGVGWVVLLKSNSVYFNESRFFKIMKNLLLFTMTIGILFSNPLPWLVLSFIVLFPILFLSSIDIYIFTGKSLGVTDEDLKKLGLTRLNSSLNMVTADVELTGVQEVATSSSVSSPIFQFAS